MSNNNVAEIRLNSGDIGRIWEVPERHRFQWAHPNGSEGFSTSFEAAEAALEDATRPADFSEYTITISDSPERLPGYSDEVSAAICDKVAELLADRYPGLNIERTSMGGASTPTRGPVTAWIEEIDEAAAGDYESVRNTLHIG